MADLRRATISRSKNGKISLRASTSVTATPSAANMLAYSQPITPPPKIVNDLGRVLMFSTSSLSWMKSSAKSMSAGRCGLEPVAMRMKSPLMRRVSPVDVIMMVCASTSCPRP
jgi:hypothetical protein